MTHTTALTIGEALNVNERQADAAARKAASLLSNKYLGLPTNCLAYYVYTDIHGKVTPLLDILDHHRPLMLTFLQRKIAVQKYHKTIQLITNSETWVYNEASCLDLVKKCQEIIIKPIAELLKTYDQASIAIANENKKFGKI